MEPSTNGIIFKGKMTRIKFRNRIKEGTYLFDIITKDVVQIVKIVEFNDYLDFTTHVKYKQWKEPRQFTLPEDRFRLATKLEIVLYAFES